ncbi:NUDIX domain-containing protein [Olivibacter sitiensis]|uniref:NUDIX domain-containing protein n=1 Tax=Olivibacter sitiensis TaxID=376470 RepID=UPI0004127ABD|nr:NUDIX hydrolase [Olivibacter sitiensis]
MSYTYPYPRPALTADIVLFSIDEQENIAVLLIKRKHEPFENCWAFPGGFMDMDERIDDTAHRELQEETGLSNIKLERLGLYDAIDRDPRGRTVSMAYVGFVYKENLLPKAADDASAVQWFELDEIPSLAFDHEQIMNDALGILNKRLE